MLDVTSTGRRILVPAFSDLRRRWLLVLTAGLVGAAATAAFSFTAQKQYRATATMLVAPVPAGDPTFVGLDVLTDAGGKHAAAATAAHLVATPEVAEAVRVRLGLSRTAPTLLSQVDTHPIGTSSTVAVTAKDSDARRAAQLANAFVDATIAARSAGFQSELISTIHRLQRRGAQGAQLQKRLADLKALVGTTDPTLRHASAARAPSSPSWPRPKRLTLFGGLIGLGVGAVLAIVLALATGGGGPPPPRARARGAGGARERGGGEAAGARGAGRGARGPRARPRSADGIARHRSCDRRARAGAGRRGARGAGRGTRRGGRARQCRPGAARGARAGGRRAG